MNRLLNFKPQDGWIGDTMPLWHDGIYHIYYTKLNDTGVTVWGHIATKDWLSYETYPDPLTEGDGNAPDAKGICTGCVIIAEGQFHMFYAASDKDCVHHMLHAVSDDGIRFIKDNEDLFPIDPSFYRTDGTWRDPCVVYDDDRQIYRMYFCTRVSDDKAAVMPGQIGCAESKDLKHWRLLPPNALTGISGSHECPDVFRLGDRWAMIYYWHDTRIRLADSLDGPWERRKVLSPNHFDFMAAKQTFDGRRHILLGWIPRKTCDCAERIWGGHLAWARELYLDTEGNPACRFIEETDALFDQAIMPVERRLNDALLIENVPDDYRLQFSFHTDNPLCVVTLFIRLCGENGWNGDFSGGYQLIFDQPSGTLRLREHYQWDQRPDIAAIPLNRANAEETDVDLLLYGDVLEVCIGQRETLTVRLKKYPHGKLAIHAADGNVTLSDMRITRTSD